MKGTLQWNQTDHLYADDSQLYVSFSTKNSSSAFLHLQKCVDSAQNWMLWNKLKTKPMQEVVFPVSHASHWGEHATVKVSKELWLHL